MITKCSSHFGHKYEARYDIGEPTLTEITARSSVAVEMVKASAPKTYVRDICVRCGNCIERQNK